MYDLLVKNGMLIDPYQNIEEKRDIAVSKGKVFSVEENINSTTAKKVVDASGKIVTPGLIDIHVHVFWGNNPGRVDADSTCLAKGVTTVLDAGSSTCLNFPGFRKFIIEQSKTRILALLNISSIGGVSFSDISIIDYDGAVEVAKANADVIKGFKMYFAAPPRDIAGKNGRVAMRLTREAADDTGGLVMIHPKSMDPKYQLDDIFKLMRKGDIVSHCFSPKYPYYFPHAEILDDNDRVRQSVKKAAERGVVFDVAHGTGAFSFDTAKKALADDFLPTTISTDLFTGSLKTAIDLPTTMSKFLALGVPLSKVVEMSTTKPAEILGYEGRLGTLKPGAEADIAIFDLEEGKFTFYDVRGKDGHPHGARMGREYVPEQASLIGQKLLKPYTVIKGGEIITSI